MGKKKATTQKDKTTVPVTARPVGRPSDYTQDVADKICAKLSGGISLRTVCIPDDMPAAATVFNWLRMKPEFVEQYARATKERTEAQQEDMLDIGDQAIEHSQHVDPKAANALVSAYKLKADNLKWSMSKMQPKKYGDKLDLTTGGEKLPAPILGGTTTHGLPSNNSSTQAPDA